MEMWCGVCDSVNSHFRSVSGRLESSETALRHTAWESYASVAYRGRWRHTGVNTAERFHEMRKSAGAKVHSASLERRSEALHATPHGPSYVLGISRNEKGTKIMFLKTTLIQKHTNVIQLYGKELKNIYTVVPPYPLIQLSAVYRGPKKN
jgi:hypothetical protein